MLQSKLFKSFFVTLVSVCFLDLIAIKLHLFSAIFWFDMVMHFAGGFFVGMLALWILTWNGRNNFSYGHILFIGIGVAFLVGVIWELFELYYGITYFYSPDYWGDNGMDVTMDTAGGLVAVLYSYFKLQTSK